MGRERRVIKLPPKQLEAFKEAIERRGVLPSPPKAPYEAYRARMGKELFIAYTSGKVIYTVSPITVGVVVEALSSIIEEPKFKVTIGSDEAGKGEWLGPLVVSAVALKRDEEIKLKALGVMDSKLLSASQIERLAHEIEGNSSSNENVVISPGRFNRLLKELSEEEKNLNDLLAWAHSKAIVGTLKRIAFNPKDILVIIDEFDRFRMERRLSRSLHPEIKILQKVGAESFTAVAAASIMARHLKERWVSQYSRELSIDIKALTKEEAMKHPRASEFTKKAYLMSSLKKDSE